MIKLGDTLYFDFTTHDPLSGNSSNADVLPTSEVFENDTDVAILTPLVSLRVGKTGDYRIQVDATVGNGFEVGKSYNIVATATVNGVTGKSRIANFTLDSKRVSDLNDIAKTDIVADNTAFNGAYIDNYITSRLTSSISDSINNISQSIQTNLDATISSRLSSSYDEYIINISNSINQNLDDTISSRLSSSFGTAINSINGNIDVPLSSRVSSSIYTPINNISSSVAINLDSNISSRASSSIENIVYNLTSSLNQISASIAENIDAKISSRSTLTSTNISEAIWDIDFSLYQNNGTFGQIISFLLGLMQSNFRILDPIYNGDNKLTSSTIRIYTSADDCNNNINPINEYSLIATYDIDGNLSSYKVIES